MEDLRKTVAGGPWPLAGERQGFLPARLTAQGSRLLSSFRREELDDARKAERVGERGDAQDRQDEPGGDEGGAAEFEAPLLARRQEVRERDEHGEARVVLGVRRGLNLQEARDLEERGEEEPAGEPREEAERDEQGAVRRDG